ncbi:YdcF family protein [Roseivirga misakiensis]|uniref:DUF218 domain-containing protein n=1 Tax=Roseivirga misakiensis TaxID=1563681 RepID=A0A1E5T537_9BACT|nr:YdcF family protein [Roseivirga misakiensis]OEK06485.1 hypothetical protein BFP71_02070 [Roseivirga misakiensis]
MSTYVIFGAAVRKGGAPSGSLQRRIDAAINMAENDDTPFFIPSGAVGKFPPSEAQVIKDELVKSGYSPNQILLDEDSIDTLESVIRCTKIINEENLRDVVVCTDRYHQPRCICLFKLSGVKARKARIAPSLLKLGFLKWAKYCLKEFLAVLYDSFLIKIYPSRAIRA